MIEVVGASFYYNSIPVLRDVTLRFESGRIACVIGPNGAGKTTLLKVIASIMKPSRGAIYIDGKNIALYSPRELAKLLAYEEPYISRSLPMTVLDFLSTARYPHQSALQYFETREDLDIIEDIAKDLGILHLLKRRLDQVSSGELQRIIIAHALVRKPKVLLLDEPSAFLDIRYRFEILDYVKRYTTKNALTTIIALHELHLASMYCDSVVVMDKGVVVSYGDPIEVLSSRIIEEVYGVEIEVVKAGDRGLIVIPIPRNLNKL